MAALAAATRLVRSDQDVDLYGNGALSPMQLAQIEQRDLQLLQVQPCNRLVRCVRRCGLGACVASRASVRACVASRASLLYFIGNDIE